MSTLGIGTVPAGLLAGHLLGRAHLPDAGAHSYIDRSDQTPASPRAAILAALDTSDETPKGWSTSLASTLGVAAVTMGLTFATAGIFDPVPRSRIHHGLRGSDSGSDQPETSTLGRFQAALNARRGFLSADTVMAFHRQLTGLLSDGAELTEAGLRPSPVSFEGLIQFLRLNPAIAHPNLALDKKGDFIASWSPHRLAKLSITFADLQSARWVAADRSPGSRGRASGSFNIDAPDIPDRFAAWMKA